MMDCFCYNCNPIIYNNLSEATLTVSKYRPESVSYILPTNSHWCDPYNLLDPTLAFNPSFRSETAYLAVPGAEVMP